MKKNYFYKICFVCIAFFVSITANGQCIWSQLTANAHSNTAHTITVNNPVSGNLQPLFPPLGTYNLTLNYLDDFNNPVTQNSSAALVTLSNAGQFVITDNSITFPTTATNNYDFPATSGSAQLSGPGGFYTWTWANDQLLNCAPLPVTLISFNISTFNVQAGYSKLTWEIVEYDNSHYIIERSTDGGLNFTDYGIEPAVGSYGSQLIYNFIVPNPNVGTNFYYRLKMIDPNGSFTYSRILLLRGSGTGNPTNFCAFTNIEGNSSICSSSNVFKVHNATPGITWATSFGTLSAASNGGGIVTLSSACPSGNVTITAGSGCAASKTLTICNPGAFSISGPATFCTTSGVYSTNPVTNVTWSVTQPGSTLSCASCLQTTLTMASSGNEWITATTTGCNPRSVTLPVKNINFTSFSTTGPHQFCKNQTGTISVNQTAYPGLSNFIWGPIPAGWTKIQGGTGSNYIVLRAPNSTSPPTFNLPVTVTNACGNSVTSNHFLAVGGPGCTAFAISPNPVTNKIITINEYDNNTGKLVQESSIKAIEIRNKMGFLSYRQQYSNKHSGGMLTIPVSSLPNDVYVVRIYDGIEWQSYKVSVQH